MARRYLRRCVKANIIIDICLAGVAVVLVISMAWDLALSGYLRTRFYGRFFEKLEAATQEKEQTNP